MDRKINPHLITIIAVLVLAILSIGSASAPEASMVHLNWGTFGEAAIMPVKDFETLGWVYTENTFTVDKKSGTIIGETFSYQELLKKAHELGADAIINVVIDKKNEEVVKRTPFYRMIIDSNKQETWYGTALAIKYTDAIIEDNLLTNNGRTYNQRSGAYVKID